MQKLTKEDCLKLLEHGHLQEALKIGLEMTRDRSDILHVNMELRHHLNRISPNTHHYLQSLQGADDIKTERNRVAYRTQEIIFGLPDDLFHGYWPSFWKNIENYIPADTPHAEWGLEIINYVNRCARQLFAPEPGESKSVNNVVWSEIFQEDEIQAQAQFVDLRERGTNEYIGQKIFRLLGDRHSKLWLIGDPGVGKTTALYNIFLHFIKKDIATDVDFIPLLLQPQELNQIDLAMMESLGSDKAGLFHGIFKTWLKKREIYLEPEDEEQVIRQIVHLVTKTQKVILLMDSYDELARMKIQVEIFSEIFYQTSQYICASRPETYNEMLPGHVLTIKSPWDIPTIRSFLEQRLTIPKEDKNKFIRYYTWFVNTDQQKESGWLRNPRYINLILKSVNPSSREELALERLREYVEKGEFGFCQEVFLLAINRVRRLTTNSGEWTREKLRPLFQRIAFSQLNYGSFLLTNKEYLEAQDIWDSLLSITEIMDKPVFAADLNSRQIRLQNQTFVDFFLTRKLVAELQDPASDISIYQLWSTNLLTFIAEFCQNEALQEDDIKKEIIRKINRLRIKAPIGAGLCRMHHLNAEESDGAFHLRFMPVNLVHLLLQIEKTYKKQLKIHNLDLSDLYLFNLDVRKAEFYGCDFNGSVLSHACLELCLFDSCDFKGVNLRFASASDATFRFCSFDFIYNTAPDSCVKNMVIQNIVIDTCETAKLDTIDDQSFIRHGAIGRKSRYSSAFGRNFFNKMNLMLGNGLVQEELIYSRHIEDAIRAKPKESQFLLVDLMCGGSNKRLNMLFPKYGNLHVLGLDRDTSSTEDIVNTVGARFSAVNIEIDGRCDLQQLIKNQFKADDGAVDLIIGKKAIHEINRNAQVELIRECAEVLKPGGHLILFADAPPEISEEAFQRLEALKQEIFAHSHDVGYIKRLLLPPDSELNFDAASPDDYAIFANLWILIKDLANDNYHEFRNRYFSSVAEIRQWAENAGLQLVNDVEKERHHYLLNPKMFNEWAINRVGILLEHTEDIFSGQNESMIIDFLMSKNRPMFQLLNTFSETYLLNSDSDRADALDSPEFTPLGKATNCEMQDIKFDIIDNRLKNLNLPYKYRKGVAFKFSVHVLVLRKPEH